jgi:hypothetical protein
MNMPSRPFHSAFCACRSGLKPSKCPGDTASHALDQLSFPGVGREARPPAQPTENTQHHPTVVQESM